MESIFLKDFSVSQRDEHFSWRFRQPSSYTRSAQLEPIFLKDILPYIIVYTTAHVMPPSFKFSEISEKAIYTFFFCLNGLGRAGVSPAPASEPRSHKGAGASWRGFSDKRRMDCDQVQEALVGRALWFFWILHYVAHRTKQRHNKGLNPGMRLSEEQTFVVNNHSLAKLYPGGAARLDGFTNLLKLYVYPSGNHTDSFFLLY